MGMCIRASVARVIPGAPVSCLLRTSAESNNRERSVHGGDTLTAVPRIGNRQTLTQEGAKADEGGVLSGRTHGRHSRKKV